MSASLPHSETTAGRKALAAKGRALPDGGFPVGDAEHWDKARQAVGRVKNPARRAALAKMLRKTAPMVGRTQALGQSWAAPAGSAHANPDLGIYLAVTAKDEQGLTLTCPECNYTGPAGTFGASGASLDKSPEDLRTPAPSTGGVRDGVPLTVRTGAAHALANGGTRAALELAGGTADGPPAPHPGPDGRAGVPRTGRDRDAAAPARRHHHREHPQDRKRPVGRVGQRPGPAAPRPPADRPDGSRRHVQQGGRVRYQAAAGAVAAAAAVQTPLMAEYGIPAIRALATPVTGATAGPRMTTTAASGAGTDENGLNAKGQGIYKKLIAKGFPPARAVTFAKMSQNTKPGQFGKVAS